MPGSIVFAGIAPHPPLLIPEVGGKRIEQVADSQRMLREFSRRLINTHPETIVVISPHSPVDPRVFTARSTTELAGDFREFYAPAVRLSFPNDLEMADAVKQAAASRGVELRLLDLDYPLDHGAMVPLYYLYEAGWRGPVVVIGFTLQSNEKHLSFGRAIASAAGAIDRRIALVASGDLSHRLVVGGPYEFEPTAHLFDEQIVDAIARGDPGGVINIDPELRNRAGECGYRSIVIALGAVGEHLWEHQVLSYEGPFGVGYMVAVLAEEDDDILPQQLARLAVEAFISRRIVIDPPESRQGVLAQRAGTFVTLRTLDGSLRGCMGTIDPAQSNVAEEIIQNAISAATRDPRFPPILTRELTELTYSVDVLSTPERARGPEDLDPAVYGVIIETLDGRHRGLLLPGIDGIASVEDQWRAVHSKAWIEPGTPVRVERFTVTRFGKD